jgi:hypothetical protein
MPNGGMLPSCFICEWSEKDEDFAKALHQCFCQRHSMNILLPHLTFCTDLTAVNKRDKPHPFIEEANIIGNDIYTWIETEPISDESAHRYRLLTAIKVYAEWSEQQKKAALNAKHRSS